MKFRTLLLGTAAAMTLAGAAQAADLAIAVEPIDYVKICDAFGVGYWYIPGTDTCLKIGGYVQLDVWFYDTDKVGDYFNIANQLTGAVTPNGQINLLGGNDAAPAPQQVAVADPAPVASTGGGAAAYVQLSSQPSAADAQNSVKSMTAKYGSLFGGTKLVVQQVDLGQMGVRWRVRLPASSLADASSICAQIKAQGGDCFATNG